MIVRTPVEPFAAGVFVGFVLAVGFWAVVWAVSHLSIQWVP